MLQFCMLTTMPCAVLQRKTMLIYKNKICFFSFPFITQNVWTGERESWKWLSLHTQGWTVQIFCETSLPFRLKSSWLYNIPDAHENSCGHISNLLLTYYTWTCLLACHPRKFLWSHLQLATTKPWGHPYH